MRRAQRGSPPAPGRSRGRGRPRSWPLDESGGRGPGFPSRSARPRLRGSARGRRSRGGRTRPGAPLATSASARQVHSPEPSDSSSQAARKSRTRPGGGPTPRGRRGRESSELLQGQADGRDPFAPRVRVNIWRRRTKSANTSGGTATLSRLASRSRAGGLPPGSPGRPSEGHRSLRAGRAGPGPLRRRTVRAGPSPAPGRSGSGS